VIKKDKQVIGNPWEACSDPENTSGLLLRYAYRNDTKECMFFNL